MSDNKSSSNAPIDWSFMTKNGKINKVITEKVIDVEDKVKEPTICENVKFNNWCCSNSGITRKDNGFQVGEGDVWLYIGAIHVGKTRTGDIYFSILAKENKKKEIHTTKISEIYEKCICKTVKEVYNIAGIVPDNYYCSDKSFKWVPVNDKMILISTGNFHQISEINKIWLTKNGKWNDIKKVSRMLGPDAYNFFEKATKNYTPDTLMDTLN